MFSDSAEETLTLTMDELQTQVPRTTLQPALSPSPPPPPLYTLKSSSSTSTEVADFPGPGIDFYSSHFDNSFPLQGFLSNERRFSCSSPTSNTSFLSETSFNAQSLLRNSQDSGITSDNFGLLTTSSTPFRGNDTSNFSDIDRFLNGGGGSTYNGNGEMGGSFLTTSHANQLLNESGLSTASFGSFNPQPGKWDSPTKATTSTPNHSLFDFSFPNSEQSITGGIGIEGSNSCASSSNGSSNASADSPSRLIAAATDAATSIPCSYQSQWNSSDVSSLLDNQSLESCSSNSVITTTALGTSIWSPSSQVSAANNDNANGQGNGNTNSVSRNNGSNSLKWDDNLIKGLSKQQLLQFVELLKEELEKSVRNGNDAQANQIRGAMVFVQNYIINTFVSESSESVCSVSTPTTTIPSPLLASPYEGSFDGISKYSREIVGSKDAPYTWSGQLPPRVHKNPTYSCKVFLGGLPWDITECTLMQAFKPFGIQKIEWPGKENVSAKPKGYAYAVFENEKQVKLLLQNCTHDYNHSRAGNYYYKVSSKKFRGKDVQIIPWALSDSNHSRCQTSKIDPLKTIFVGALHGMVNAEGLAKIMNDLFGGVVYAGIDTDRTKYPIGSARVTFNNTHSYMKAVTAAFVVIKTARFEKKLQVDPYLEDATCSVCNLQQGPYFCRDSACFSYFCRTCFKFKHSEGPFTHHRPMMRTTHNKPQQQQQQQPQQQQQQQTNLFNNCNNSRGYNSPGSGFNSNNHYNQSPYYSGPTNHHHNNHGNAHHGYNGGGGNNRQWGNGMNGRNSPQINCGGLGVPNGPMNGGGGGGGFPKYNGGHFGGGGGGNNNGNGHGHQQVCHNNRNFGLVVGHRQQQQQFTRWQN